jgi:hypothetical protein
MRNLHEFVNNYYNNNLIFDQNGFLSVIDMLMKESITNCNINDLNIVLIKVMNAYERQDYYLVMQIIEYELLSTVTNRR